MSTTFCKGLYDDTPIFDRTLCLEKNLWQYSNLKTWSSFFAHADLAGSNLILTSFYHSYDR